MTSKRHAKGYSANLLDMSYAQRLSNEDASRLSGEYGLANTSALQEAFALWAIIYRNNSAMYDNAPSPSIVRDTAKDIAKWARKLSEVLDGLDGRTRRAVEQVVFDDQTPFTLRHDFDVLQVHGAATAHEMRIPNKAEVHVERGMDLDVIASGVRLLEDQARRTAEHIQKVMDDKGRKKPKLYESDFALVMLINAIREYWEREKGPYTRSFDDFDDLTGKPAAIPKNAASNFTVSIVALIAPHYSASQVERAMKEHIKTWGKSPPERGHDIS